MGFCALCQLARIIVNSVPVAGWVTRTAQAQQGNVALWAAAPQIPANYHYILRVTDISALAQ